MIVRQGAFALFGLVARNHAWQDRFYDAIRPYSTGGAYQNFIDPSLKDWRQASRWAEYPSIWRKSRRGAA